MTASLDLGVHRLRAAYRLGALDCKKVIEEVLSRIAAAGDDKVWISRVSDEALRQAAATLDARRGEFERLPLYGVPFAVKDNIDVEGMVTTAACPGFAYQAKASAEVVRRLVEAGAIVVGRPISISSPPAWSACARPTAFRAIRSTPTTSPAARARARRSRYRRAW